MEKKNINLISSPYIYFFPVSRGISIRTEKGARACVTIGQRKLSHVGIRAEDKFPRGPVRESTF